MKIQDKSFTLVDVDSYDEFSRKNNVLYSNITLPIRSRMMQITCIPKKIKQLSQVEFKPHVYSVAEKAKLLKQTPLKVFRNVVLVIPER